MEKGGPIKPIPHMIKRTVSDYPDKNALISPVDGRYEQVTYSEMDKNIDSLATGLVSLDLDEKQIAVDLGNRPECAISDYAIMTSGGISVPVYLNQKREYLDYVLSDSDAAAVIVSKPEEIEKIEDVRGSLPNLQYLITLNGKKNYYRNILPLSEVMERGREKENHKLNELYNSLSLEDSAKLIYTSGTTGEPKGVLLGHGALSHNASACINRLNLNKDDTLLLFIPWQHSYGGINQLSMHATGGTIAYSSKFSLMKDISNINPTIVPGPPELFEKIYSGVLKKVGEKNLAERLAFNAFTKTSIAYHGTKGNDLLRSLNKFLGFVDSIGNKKVYSEIKKMAGENLRFFVSGGGPLKEEHSKYLQAWGIPVLNGYGLTEYAPVVAVNEPDDIKHDSVGKPVEGVETKLGKDGELLIKGPSVMKKYWKKPKETENVLKDGWLYTRDMAEIEDGHIKIKYRKNYIVLSNGENLPLGPIKKVVDELEDVYSVIVGQGEKYPAALLFPKEEDYKADKNYIKNQLKRSPIKKVVIMPHKLDEIEDLTPTLKVKRGFLEKKYDSVKERIFSRKHTKDVEVLYLHDL